MELVTFFAIKISKYIVFFFARSDLVSFFIVALILGLYYEINTPPRGGVLNRAK